MFLQAVPSGKLTNKWLLNHSSTWNLLWLVINYTSTQNCMQLWTANVQTLPKITMTRCFSNIYTPSSTMVALLKLALIVASIELHLKKFCIRLLCTWHASGISFLLPTPDTKTYQCRLVRPPPAIECWRCWPATRWRWCFVWAPLELDRELSPYYLQHAPLYNTTVAIIVKLLVYLLNSSLPTKTNYDVNYPENALISTPSFQLNPLGDSQTVSRRW